MRLLAAAVLLGHFAIACGCRISGPPSGESDLRSLEHRITELIGEAPALSVAACKTLAFGSKPCGGPWSYLVYSSEFTDEAELTELVERYNRLQDRLNRESGAVSDCSIAVEPAVVHVDGFCRTAGTTMP